MKTLLYALVAASSFTASASAILGDDEAETARKYGKSVHADQLYGCSTQEYFCKGYDIVVVFVDGRSASESISRKEGVKTLSPEIIQSFLKAHSAGKTWRSEPPLATGPRWQREGAMAFYSNDPKSPELMIMTGDFLARVQTATATPAPTATPSPVVATIKGNGDKTSDPFTITKEGGFTIEYQTSGGYLGLTLHKRDERRSVADASLHAAGKDHTFVDAGPGTYYLKITSVSDGEYSVTVRE